MRTTLPVGLKHDVPATANTLAYHTSSTAADPQGAVIDNDADVLGTMGEVGPIRVGDGSTSGGMYALRKGTSGYTLVPHFSFRPRRSQRQRQGQ